MIVARQLLKLQNLCKTTPIFKFQTENVIEGEGEQKRTPKPKFKKVAIVLSGCGVYDGSEVTEVVSLMVQLNKMHVDFQCFAPNTNQTQVVNHVTGETTTETRNVLVESARIARGEVKDIAQLYANDYQAIILPGGFGVAKNLSDYAVNGGSFNVHQEVERVLRDFHAQKKPIGAMCISPLLLAKVFQNEKPKITMGRIDNTDSQVKYWPHSDAINVAESLGAQHMQRNGDKFQIDFDNKLVTVPAMMFNGFTKFSTTFDGAGSLVKIIEQIVMGNSVNIESFITPREKRNNTGVNHETHTSYTSSNENRPYRERRNYNNNNNNNNNNNEQRESKRRYNNYNQQNDIEEH